MRNSILKTRMYGLLSWCRPFVPHTYYDGQVETVNAGESYLVLEIVLTWIDDFEIPLNELQSVEIKELAVGLGMEIPDWFAPHLK